MGTNSKLKKVIAFSLCIVFVLSLMTTSFAASTYTKTESAHSMYGDVFVKATYTKSSSGIKITSTSAWSTDSYMKLQVITKDDTTSSAKATFFDSFHKVYAYVTVICD